MDCRTGCAACCVAPSITSAMPGMPDGKPAGTACANLTEDLRCGLFGRPERPDFCSSLRASAEMCGTSRSEALVFLENLERLTGPGRRPGS